MHARTPIVLKQPFVMSGLTATGKSYFNAHPVNRASRLTSNESERLEVSATRITFVQSIGRGSRREDVLRKSGCELLSYPTAQLDCPNRHQPR
jgi:hypothetical protein